MDTTSNILTPKKAILENFSFTPVKMMEWGGRKSKVSYLNYQNRPFFLRLPKLHIKFELSVFENDPNKNSLNLTLSVHNYETDEKVAALHRLFTELNKKLREEAKKNSGDWLGKHSQKISQEFLDLKVKPVIKQKDGYTPNISLKFGRDKNNPDIFVGVQFFDERKKRLDLTVEEAKTILVRGTEISTIVRVTPWINTSIGCGITLKPVQVHIFDRKVLDEDVCNSDEDGNDDEHVEATPIVNESGDVGGYISSSEAEESSENEEKV